MSKRKEKITNPLTKKKIYLGGLKHKQLIEESVLDENGNDIRPNIVHETIKVNVIHNLPKDVIDIITNTTPIEFVLNLCKSNKKYNEWICNNANFWRRRLKHDYDITLPSSPSLEKKMYMEIYKSYIMPDSVFDFLSEYTVGFHLVTAEGQNIIFRDFAKYFKDRMKSHIDRYTKEITKTGKKKTLKDKIEYSKNYKFKYDKFENPSSVTVDNNFLEDIFIPLSYYLDLGMRWVSSDDLIGVYDVNLFYEVYKDMVTFLG